ncbi:hypothetical protein GTZ99_15355 [Novosphingobium sp. FSY-8]|uniref:Uncharacterized protein n=1 Tax=Novosphingobium ovatum TaxID=1908523 RepID=A0ABW9XHF1_9SPHN|nr:hypothetical protein [Novosphingobium ovatum]
MAALALGASSLVAAPAQPAPPPAAAAGAGQEKVNMIIVFGDDKCPESTADVINVCARKDEGERFRIPAMFREPVGPQNEAWNQRVLAYETVGATGTASCSPVGAGGWTGCSQKLIDNAYAERRASSDVQFSRLIEAERDKRLGKIDAQAAAQQSDVEDAERAYLARQAAQRAAAGKPAPAPTPTATPTPGMHN